MTLANELANSLGGRLSVESKSESGSTFIFSMKTEIYSANLNYNIEDVEVNNNSIKNIPINTYDKSKILIIEDNPEMNAYLTEILSENYSCDVAFDGIEGLQKV